MPEPYSVKFEPSIPLMLRDGTITYVDVFRAIGLASIGLGVLLFVLAFPIKRWMHGVQ